MQANYAPARCTLWHLQRPTNHSSYAWPEAALTRAIGSRRQLLAVDMKSLQLGPAESRDGKDDLFARARAVCVITTAHG